MRRAIHIFEQTVKLISTREYNISILKSILLFQQSSHREPEWVTFATPICIGELSLLNPESLQPERTSDQGNVKINLVMF